MSVSNFLQSFFFQSKEHSSKSPTLTWIFSAKLVHYDSLLFSVFIQVDGTAVRSQELNRQKQLSSTTCWLLSSLHFAKDWTDGRKLGLSQGVHWNNLCSLAANSRGGICCSKSSWTLKDPCLHNRGGSGEECAEYALHELVLCFALKKQKTRKPQQLPNYQVWGHLFTHLSPFQTPPTFDCMAPDGIKASLTSSLEKWYGWAAAIQDERLGKQGG